MLKKFLIMICLCFLPIIQSFATNDILGHAIYYKVNEASYGNAFGIKIGNDWKYGDGYNETLLFYSAEGKKAKFNGGNCSCRACENTGAVNGGIMNVPLSGTLNDLCYELKSYYSGYDEIAAYGVVDAQCSNDNHTDIMVYEIVGIKGDPVVPERYQVKLSNKAGEGIVRFNGVEVKQSDYSEFSKWSRCIVTFEPAEGWKLVRVGDNNNPNAHSYLSEPYSIIVTEDHEIDVVFERERYELKVISNNPELGNVEITEDYEGNINKGTVESDLNPRARRYIQIRPNSGNKFSRLDDESSTKKNENAHTDFGDAFTPYPYPVDINNSNRTIYVSFTDGRGGPTGTQYTVTLDYNENQGLVYINDSPTDKTNKSINKKATGITGGSKKYIHIEPKSNYKLEEVIDEENPNGYTFTNAKSPEVYEIEVNSNREIKVNFDGGTTIGGDYKIILDYNPTDGTAYISKDSNSISAGSKTDNETDITRGSNRYIHIQPNEGYSIDSVVDKSNGTTVALNKNGISYPIENILSNHTVSIDFEGGTPIPGQYNITVNIVSGSGSACISNSSNTLVSSNGRTSENVSSGSERYIHFFPSSGYKLSRVQDVGLSDNAHIYLDYPYVTGQITSNRIINVYFEEEIPTIVTFGGDPYKHMITTLNVKNPSSVSTPKIYEKGENLGLKTDFAYTQLIQLITEKPILGNANFKNFNDLHSDNEGKPKKNQNLEVFLANAGDYDERINGVGVNKIDITAFYPYSIHRALQTIYISPNWWTPTHNYDSALKIVSVRDIRWQNIYNTSKPKWGLSTDNKSKPLLPKTNVTLAGQTVDISKLKTGYAVEFEFDVTKEFMAHNSRNIRIDVSFSKNNIKYRKSYGAASESLPGYFRTFKLRNNSEATKAFNITENKHSDGSATYRFVYYLPPTICNSDGSGFGFGDELKIYFNVTMMKDGLDYFNYNNFVGDFYGYGSKWNGHVFTYNLNKTNLEDLGSNAN